MGSRACKERLFKEFLATIRSFHAIGLLIVMLLFYLVVSLIGFFFVVGARKAYYSVGLWLVVGNFLRAIMLQA